MSLHEIEAEIHEKETRLRIIRYGRRGYSREKIAHKLGISVKKVRYWQEKFRSQG